MPGDDFQAQWRDRLASGSKLAAHALAQAVKEDPSRVAVLARLAGDPHPNVRLCALRALAEVAHAEPAAVAQHAREIVEGLAAPEPDAQAAALDALGHVCSRARAEAALALPLIAELMDARRPALREDAARCLGRIGAEVPESAPAAAHALLDHLAGVKATRQATEAREVLAAIERLLPNLPAPDRAALAPRVQPLRAHPNLQVRERAGRIARALTA